MRLALAQAAVPGARRAAEVPVGAVVLDPAGAVAARAHNQCQS